MEKIKTTNAAMTAQLIDCTPEDLREIADNLERAAKHALSGSSVTFPISTNVALHFRVPTIPFKNVKSDSRDSHQTFEQ